MKQEGADFSGVTHYTHVDVQPGGINIQNVEHLYQADILKQLGIELEVKQKAAEAAPLECTEGAKSAERPESTETLARLRPMFFGQEDEARAFLVSIQGMKPTQITDRVNRLVSERKISDMSKHRDLWKVLHDCGLYDKSESNWNQQVK